MENLIHHVWVSCIEVQPKSDGSDGCFLSPHYRSNTCNMHLNIVQQSCNCGVHELCGTLPHVSTNTTQDQEMHNCPSMYVAGTSVEIWDRFPSISRSESVGHGNGLRFPFHFSSKKSNNLPVLEVGENNYQRTSENFHWKQPQAT